MTGLSLTTLANLAEIIGAGSIITGLVFGWFQIRQYRIQQRDAIAMNLAQTFYSNDLAQAISLVQTLPDGISLEEIRERGPEYSQAPVTITTSFETMGLLVFKRIASSALVMDLAGGIVTTMTRKLERWLEDLRLEQEQPSWGERFEWLGRQAAKIQSVSEPAHIKYRFFTKF
jgi:hypothetical protein